MKLLALDFGGRRIGVAAGDSEIGVANARNFLVNDGEIFENLRELVEREGAGKVLVGLPLGFSGETEQTKLAREFAAELDSKIAATVELADERFTTRLAERNLRSANFDSREQKNLVDSESARIILQEYFDSNE